MAHTSKKSEHVLKRIIQSLKEIRLAKGMSHSGLARRTGVTRPAISHIENGRRKPSLLIMLRLTEALGQDFSDIVKAAERGPAK